LEKRSAGALLKKAYITVRELKRRGNAKCQAYERRKGDTEGVTSAAEKCEPCNIKISWGERRMRERSGQVAVFQTIVWENAQDRRRSFDRCKMFSVWGVSGPGREEASRGRGQPPLEYIRKELDTPRHPKRNLCHRQNTQRIQKDKEGENLPRARWEAGGAG